MFYRGCFVVGQRFDPQLSLPPSLRFFFFVGVSTLHRQYFAFGEPIETAHYEGDWENLAKCSEVYCKIKGEVERLILKLQVVQGEISAVQKRTRLGCLRAFIINGCLVPPFVLLTLFIPCCLWLKSSTTWLLLVL